MSNDFVETSHNRRLVRWLTCLMFFTFAMTTDAVGSVIPRIIEEFALSMTAAGGFHYATMGGIAAGALLLSDAYESPRAGFILATGFALLLSVGLVANWALDPTRRRLETADREDYSSALAEPSRAP